MHWMKSASGASGHELAVFFFLKKKKNIFHVYKVYAMIARVPPSRHGDMGEEY
jgi:hypothetical protein